MEKYNFFQSHEVRKFTLQGEYIHSKRYNVTLQTFLKISIKLKPNMEIVNSRKTLYPLRSITKPGEARRQKVSRGTGAPTLCTGSQAIFQGWVSILCSTLQRTRVPRRETNASYFSYFHIEIVVGLSKE